MAKANVVLCMNAADNYQTSYANNSLLQKKILLKTKPIMEDTIRTLFISNAFPNCIKVADLGCASGPNTFFTISEIIDTVNWICQQTRRNKSPEIQIFLNDLPQNDFNHVFMNVPSFYERLREENGDKLGSCFIAGVPGSFHGRLFPSKSMHFIHSSYSVHWLSKVPPGLDNCRNIYMAKSSPLNVFKAYSEQFEKDFSDFLRSRSQELVAGGGMLLTLIGRSIADPTSKDCSTLWELLTKSLLELAAEGLVEESDVDSFNMPYYNPCQEEIWEIVAKEGSFDLDKLEIFQVNWDPEDDLSDKNFVFNKYISGQNVANCIRAVAESLLASHFGKTIIDDLFSRYAQNVADHLSVEKTKHVNVVISLIRK